MKKVFVQAVTCGAFASALMLMGDISTNDLTLPILFRGDLSPANAAYTINRSGVYRLTSAKTASGVPNISIVANNVTLDLGGNTLAGGTNGIEIAGDNVTVKNGTISGIAQSGILVQGAGCQVQNCDFVLCTTGITLQDASECAVENCRIRTMTQAGVSLQSTWTSSVVGCDISGVHGSANVYGIVASNGGNNSIEQCAIRDLQTNSATVGHEVGGIILDNEVASNARNNHIGSVMSLTTTAGAYGVLTRMALESAVRMPGQPVQSAASPQVSFDSAGNAFAVWYQSDGTRNQIYYARYTADAGWSDAVKMPLQPLNAGIAPQVSFDGVGNAIAVWYQSGINPDQIYYARYTAGSAWSNAATIPGQEPYAGVYPQISFDSTGNAFAVWYQSDGTRNQIYYARYTAGSGWSNAAKMPGQEPYAGSFPQVSFDSADNALAVWSQSDGTKSQIYYSRYTTGSGWSDAAKVPGQLSQDGYAPQLSFDGADNAFAVWRQSDGAHDQAYYARYTAGSGWGNATKFPGQPAQNATSPQIACDSAGNALAVWPQFFSPVYQMYYARYTAGSGWSNAVRMPGQPLQNASSP